MTPKHSLVTIACASVVGLLVWYSQRAAQADAMERLKQVEKAMLTMQASRATSEKLFSLAAASAPSHSAANASTGRPQLREREKEATVREEEGDEGEQELPKRPGERPDPAREVANFAEKLDGHLARASADSAWNPTAQIAKAFQSIPNARVNEVRCSADFCRVKVNHTDQAEIVKLAEQLGRAEPFSNGTLFRYGDGDTPLATALYVAAPGHSFPE